MIRTIRDDLDIYFLLRRIATWAIELDSYIAIESKLKPSKKHYGLYYLIYATGQDINDSCLSIQNYLAGEFHTRYSDIELSDIVEYVMQTHVLIEIILCEIRIQVAKLEAKPKRKSKTPRGKKGNGKAIDRLCRD